MPALYARLWEYGSNNGSLQRGIVKMPNINAELTHAEVRLKAQQTVIVNMLHVIRKQEKIIEEIQEEISTLKLKLVSIWK